VFAVNTLGALVILLGTDPIYAYASAVLFGCSFMAAPAAITIVARQELTDLSFTAGVALLTVAFATGQILGPVLSGAVTDAVGRVSAGLWISPLLLAFAALTALKQRSAVAI